MCEVTVLVRNRFWVAMWLPRLSFPPAAAQVPLPEASVVRTQPAVVAPANLNPSVSKVPVTSNFALGVEVPIPMSPVEVIVSLLKDAVASKIENFPAPMPAVPAEMIDQLRPEAAVLFNLKNASPLAVTSMFSDPEVLRTVNFDPGVVVPMPTFVPVSKSRESPIALEAVNLGILLVVPEPPIVPPPLEDIALFTKAVVAREVSLSAVKGVGP